MRYGLINPFRNKPRFLCVCSISCWKTLWEKEKLLLISNSPFPMVFSTCLENFLPFSSRLKLSSGSSFSLDKGSCVDQWWSVWLVIQGSWVRAALDSLGFVVGVSLDKTLQSPSLVLVKPRKTWIMWAVAVIWLKYCWKRHKTPFNQSV